MTLEQQIRLNEILLDREKAFARIAAIEAEIDTILGQSFPYPPPPDLPSRQKRKKSRRAKKAKPPDPIRLGPLGPDEHAYRIHFLEDGVPACENHFAPGPLERLLALTPEGIRVTRIEILDTDGNALRTAFQAPDADSGPE